MSNSAISLTRSSSAAATADSAPVDGDDQATGAPAPSLLRDLVALTKPRITATVVATMLAGAHVASRSTNTKAGAAALLLALVGTVLVVSAANALNMYLERESDRFMGRTRNRPLPAGRLQPNVALLVGCALGLLAAPPLLLGGGLVTALLAFFAFVSYVAIYTPLKRRTTLALPIGAVPGAIPPLLGWTAVRGQIEPLGLLLFALLFLWQLPHFHAIGTFRAREYEAAGLQVLFATRGERTTRAHALVEAIALVAVSLAIPVLGGASWTYGAIAATLGVVFVSVTAKADASPARWGKRVFGTSIGYLVLLLVALVVG